MKSPKSISFLEAGDDQKATDSLDESVAKMRKRLGHYRRRIDELAHERAELQHFKDCVVGLWATDVPEKIKHKGDRKILFQIKDDHK